MIDAFDDELIEIAKENSNVMIIGADDGRYMNRVTEKIKKQYVNVGISECNAIGMAAGLASCGKIPFVTAGGTFLVHRANEFIRDDVCLQSRNVKIVAIGAGFAMNALGNTQHMTEDIATLRAFPNLTIVSATSPMEAKMIAREAAKYYGPMLIRLGRHEGKDIYCEKSLNFQIGKGQIIQEGADISIVSTGTILSDVIMAQQKLQNQDISAQVINMHTVKPLDVDILRHIEKTTGKILVVEEHSVIGGLKGAIAEAIMDNDLNIKMRGLGLNDCFASGYGSYKDIKSANGLSVDAIVNMSKQLILIK